MNNKELIKKYDNQIEGINYMLSALAFIDLIDNETIEKIDIQLRSCRNVLKSAKEKLIDNIGGVKWKRIK